MYRKFLDLGLQPLANKYLRKKDLIKKKEHFYHLEVGFNAKTKLVAILKNISAERIQNEILKLRLSKLRKSLF